MPISIVGNLERLIVFWNLHAKPTIRGLRYTVAIILELLSFGMIVEEIPADYENLEGESILAALYYAGQLFIPP